MKWVTARILLLALAAAACFTGLGFLMADTYGISLDGAVTGLSISGTAAAEESEQNTQGDSSQTENGSPKSSVTSSQASETSANSSVRSAPSVSRFTSSSSRAQSSSISSQLAADASSCWGNTGMSNLSRVYEYGKSLLDPNERVVYAQIAAGVLNVQTSIGISTTIVPSEFAKIWSYYTSDHVENFYLNISGINMRYSYSVDNLGNYQYTLYPVYSYDGNTVDAGTVISLRSKMDSAAGKIIAYAKASAGSEQLSIERALHDSVIAAFSYDTDSDNNPASFTCCGAFLNNTAVCEGYSKALKLLLDSQGIPSLYVTGTALGLEHGWNFACIDGKWTQLDVTFDDPIVNGSNSNTQPYYTYFNKASLDGHTITDYTGSNNTNYDTMPTTHDVS